MTKRLLSLVYICFFVLSQANGQSAYTAYKTSRWSDLSFEGKAWNHRDEIISLQNYFLNFSEQPRDILSDYETMILSILPEVHAQKALMDDLNIDCESLRLCDYEIEMMGAQEKQNYLDKISQILGNYSITESERTDLYNELDSYEGLTSTELEMDMELLRCYVGKTDCPKYTKLEVFRDFTGYCDPAAFESDISTNWEESYPLFFRREKQGLSAVDANDRLNTLNNCSCNYLQTELPLLYNENISQSKLIENKDLSVITASPNPTRGEIDLSIYMKAKSKVYVTIFDLSGKLVKEIYSGEFRKGMHYLSWDGKNKEGKRVNSGIYFCRIHTADTKESIKIVMIND